MSERDSHANRRRENQPEAPEVSVIMPIRNEASEIVETLATVLSQRFDSTFEVVVADGRSSDGTRELVESVSSRDPRVRLVDNVHGGTPQGLNTALAAARGRYVVRVDGHARVPEDFLQRLVNHLRAGRCEAAGGRVRAVGSTWFGRAVAAANDSRFGIGNAAHHYATRSQLIDHVPFGAYITERVRALGGWDEAFVKNQDFEFDYRYALAGGRILLDPDVVSDWRIRERPRDLARQYFGYGFWRFRSLAHHPASLRVRWLVPPGLVATLIVGAATARTRRGRRALALVAGTYGVFVATGALSLARRRGVRIAPGCAVALATMHLAWGAGFLTSAARLVLQRARRTPGEGRRRRQHVA